MDTRADQLKELLDQLPRLRLLVDEENRKRISEESSVSTVIDTSQERFFKQEKTVTSIQHVLDVRSVEIHLETEKRCLCKELLFGILAVVLVLKVMTNLYTRYVTYTVITSFAKRFYLICMTLRGST